MKDLKNLKGAKELSKQEQKTIKGGKVYCGDGKPCRPGTICNGTWCVPYMLP